ncbi:MAG: cephalosporin hydroxylase family protein [Magnetococcales bacterium]|nr:cephalosporin hydroxylase family protein [Magnetococcales bacterium]
MVSDFEQFDQQRREITQKMCQDDRFQSLRKDWFAISVDHKYCYNFDWMGMPIIQYPQDIMAMQEIIWHVRPEMIIETGIARGGSIVFYASMLELFGIDGTVVGIDIEIRPWNKQRILSHPVSHRIRMIEGSSVNLDVVKQVYQMAGGSSNVMVVLDANHSYESVRHELQLYSPLVSVGSYIVVFDTVSDDLPDELWRQKDSKTGLLSGGQGNGPKKAVHEFVQNNDAFIIDKSIQNKLQITSAPDGYLKRIK